MKPSLIILKGKCMIRQDQLMAINMQDFKMKIFLMLLEGSVDNKDIQEEVKEEWEDFNLSLKIYLDFREEKRPKEGMNQST